ncbi:hypothetical protein Rhal01_01101 [Rubritalea halochordaticola]|uniref:FecR protein domain-containing protein n=1 Tax=Rubritalea halochordaticola TaxID=714537 RepID=A0ABP9UYY2_9BACT
MNQQTFEDLLSRLVDNQLTKEEHAQLELHLLNAPDARAQYLEYMDMQNLLLLEMEKKDHILKDAPKVINIDNVVRMQRKRSVRIATLSAVAVLILTGIILGLLATDKNTPPLAFQTSAGTQYTLTHSSEADADTSAKTMHHGSRLQISQGVVEFTFESGVKAIILAPADLTLYNDKTVSLKEGNAWFQVPKGAEGFTVKTKQMDVVDLGTEFGVLSSPQYPDEVHVLRGKVQITSLTGHKEELEATAQQGFSIEHSGHIAETDFRSDLFLTELPKGLAYTHWSFDKVKDGAFTADGSMPELLSGSARPVSTDAHSMQTDGKVGKGVRFDAKPTNTLVSQWYNLPSDQAGSLCCWVKVDQTSLKEHGTGLVAWGVSKQSFDGWSGNIKLALSPEGTVSLLGFNSSFRSNIHVADGHWHHIAATYKANKGQPEVNLYLDGRKVSCDRAILASENTPSIHRTPQSNRIIQEVLFGSNIKNTNPIKGSLDEIYIFKGVIDETTIKQLANGLSYTPEKTK